MCVNGLIGVTISTLEQRFDFSSTQASLISSVYEFASMSHWWINKQDKAGKQCKQRNRANRVNAMV